MEALNGPLGNMLFVVILVVIIAVTASSVNRMNKSEKSKERSGSLQRIMSDADSSISNIPLHLEKANEFLDQAEVDFKEGAFSPFWSSIEKATLSLGGFDGDLLEIQKNLQSYSTLKLEIEAEQRFESPKKQIKIMPFPVSYDIKPALLTSKLITDRMNSIVREAQKDFQFSTIFEQRKTNQLLIAGFQTLANAVDGMGIRIAASIGTLSEDLKSLGEQQATRDAQIISKLDNIQRRRVPKDLKSYESRGIIHDILPDPNKDY